MQKYLRIILTDKGNALVYDRNGIYLIESIYTKDSRSWHKTETKLKRAKDAIRKQIRTIRYDLRFISSDNLNSTQPGRIARMMEQKRARFYEIALESKRPMNKLKH